MTSKRGIGWFLAALTLGAVGLVAALVVSRNGTRVLTIPSGTRIAGALERELSTGGSRVGDRVTITTSEPLEVSPDTALPANTSLDGEITHLQEGEAPELTIRFTRLTVQGRRYPIAAEPFRLRGRGSTPGSPADPGGARPIDNGTAIPTEAGRIVVPAGRRLRLELREPVRVRFRPGAAPGDSTRQ